MKQFFKFMLASMCGIITLTVIGLVIFAIIVASVVAGSQPTVIAEEGSVFVLNLKGVVSERAEESAPFSALLGMNDAEELGLDDILSAIKKAKNEKNIKGIYIEGGTVEFDAPATAQQIRDALTDFRKSGKWVVAYADQYLQGAYYVCSAANELYLNATGMIDFKGLGGKSYYLKGLYDKVGVKYQAARVGRYKSYVESVTRTDMSDDDRIQRQAYIDGIWAHWLGDIAQSRQVTTGQLNQLANDSIMLFANAEDYVTAHLVDKLMYPEDIKKVVRKKLGLTEGDELHQLSLEDMGNLVVEEKKDKGDQIAVYYAYGEIIDEALTGLVSGHAIVGKQTVDDLNALAQDDEVKAVVIRVNSGGGSAVASQQIWHAVKQLKTKKPVVVSMGGAAASGGYMISCAADYIFAEPTTITGSIGIFALIPNVSSLVTEKLGVTWDGVKTNTFTDYDNALVFAEENDDVMRHMQNYTDRGYESFLDIVADGRGLTKQQVHEVAQGRVWLAADAVGIQLVDSLGSLDEAVKKAAALAKVSHYHSCSYPEKSHWSDYLFDDEQQPDNYLADRQLRLMLGDLYEPVMDLRRNQVRSTLQTRLPFSIAVR